MAHRLLKPWARKGTEPAPPARGATGAAATPDGSGLLSAQNRTSVPLAALDLVRELFKGVENFVLSTPDLDAPGFLRRLRRVSARIKPDTEAEELDLHREWAAETMVEHGQFQRRYLSERESELWRLLTLYQESQKLESVVNQQFHEALRGFHERLGSVTRLEDIRAVRERMEAELGRVSSLVELKAKADAERTASLAEQVQALELDLLRARDEALRDPLTGVYHRGAFTDQMQALLESPGGLSVAMIDVDNFKEVNDTHGHLAGDQLLRRVVEEVCSLSRPGDVVGRYGGDEFCLLAPATAPGKLAERLDALAGARTVTVHVEERSVSAKLSISIGVAGFRPGDTPSSLLERADFFLYEAKRGGKARVCGETDTTARP